MESRKMEDGRREYEKELSTSEVMGAINVELRN